MFWIGLIVGILVGVFGYFGYDKYAGSTVDRIHKAEAKLLVLKQKVASESGKL